MLKCSNDLAVAPKLSSLRPDGAGSYDIVNNEREFRLSIDLPGVRSQI